MTFREPGPASILGVVAVAAIVAGGVAWQIAVAVVKWLAGWLD